MTQFYKIANITDEWMEGGQEEQWSELLGKAGGCTNSLEQTATFKPRSAGDTIYWRITVYSMGEENGFTSFNF